MSEKLVWLEMRPKPRFRWSWWGWKKIGNRPATAMQQRNFASIVLAPWVESGFQVRFKNAKRGKK